VGAVAECAKLSTNIQLIKVKNISGVFLKKLNFQNYFTG